MSRRPDAARLSDVAPGRDAATAVLAALPYPVLLVVGTAVLDGRTPADRARWLAYASTDLTNLSRHPVPSLVLSALVCEGDLVVWAVLGLVGLAALGRRLGAVRALGLAFGVHVLATLVSQGLVAYRIDTGRLPGSARVMSDVGPSYVVVAALAGALAAGTLGGRLAAAPGYAVLTPSIVDGLERLDVAAVGHVTSTVLAVVLAPVLHGARHRWRPSADSNRGP